MAQAAARTSHCHRPPDRALHSVSLSRIPPVYSPVGLSALWRGCATAVLPGARSEATGAIEAWLRGRFKPHEALLTDSGTTALTLAMRLAAAGHPVALPAYGCYDLATACDGAGVEVLLYDVDPATLGPDWSSLASALANGAGSVMVVHLYGLPVDMARVRSLAEPHAAIVIEDAAQGIGGTYNGRPLGCHGDLAVLSFGRGKGVTAGGGGALLARTPQFAARLKDLSLAPAQAGVAALAKTAVQWALGRPSLYWIPASLPFLGLGETVYHPVQTGHRLSYSGLGILAGALELEAAATATRHRNGERLRAAAKGSAGVALIGPPPGSVPGDLRLPVLERDPGRSPLRSSTARKLGVAPGYPLSLADLEGFTPRIRNRAGAFPGARRLAAGLMTLPTHELVAEAGLVRLEQLLLGPSAG